MSNCPKENRTITAAQSVAGQRIVILKPASASTFVLEVTVQPDADCHLQLFEGSSQLPMSLLIYLLGSQGEVWSAPGKEIQDDLELYCQEGGVNLQVEVRSIAAANN
jgi:hypothetical protein